MTEESASSPEGESTSVAPSSGEGQTGADTQDDARTDCGAESRDSSTRAASTDNRPPAEPAARNHGAPTWSPSTVGLFLGVLVVALLAPTAADAVARGRLFYAGELLVVGGVLYGAVAEWLCRTTGGTDSNEPSSNPDGRELEEGAAFVVDALYLVGVVLAVLGLVWIVVETTPTLPGWL